MRNNNFKKVVPICLVGSISDYFSEVCIYVEALKVHALWSEYLLCLKPPLSVSEFSPHWNLPTNLEINIFEF